MEYIVLASILVAAGIIAAIWLKYDASHHPKH
jgi:hypothetical protein